MLNHAIADLAPLKDADWPREIAEMCHGFAGALNVYRTMAHHPALLRAWAALRMHVVKNSALNDRDLEIVILRTGHRLGSEYEWSQHVLRGRKSGLSDDIIRSLTGPIAMIDPTAQLLCAAVDELFDSSVLTQRTLAQLLERHGKHATFDVMATVGFYQTLGFILQTCQTPLDADAAEELRSNPL